MLPRRLDPLGPEEIQEHPEVAQHRPGLVVGDRLIPQGLLLGRGELEFLHRRSLGNLGLAFRLGCACSKLTPEEPPLPPLRNCQFAEHLYRLRGVFCWKTQGFQGEGGDATTSGGIMAG